MRRVVRLFATAGALTALFAPSFALAAAGPQASTLTTSTSQASEQIRYHKQFGTPEVVSGRFVVGEKADKALAAQQFIAERQGLFRIQDPSEELAVMKQETDRLGYEHVRFRQTFQGLRVWGCETIAHFDSDEVLYLIGGQTIATPEISTVPAVGESTARAVAEVEALRSDPPGKDVVGAELLVYPEGEQVHLCWLVTVERLEGGIPCRWRVFVDAVTGEIRHRYNDLPEDGPFIGSGLDIFDTTRMFEAYRISNLNYMVDASRPMFVEPVTNYQGVIKTCFLNATSMTRDINGDSVFNDHPDYDEAISAHYNLPQAYEYFLNRFGWNSYDGAGGTITGVAHASGVTNNAYYMGGGEIQFGSGDDVNWLAFSGSLDVVTHELGHGVTQWTADLIYQFESGALSESYSDVWGVMADAEDWLVCEDIRLAAPGFLRSFENPPAAGQPMHMSEWLFVPSESDNGGVHTNSGIPNHVTYVVAQQIGRYKTEEIWWRTLTTYMTPGSGMTFWATSTEQAAIDLYGATSAEAAAVKMAMDSVGIVTSPLVSLPAIDLMVPIGEVVDTSFAISCGPFDTVTIDSVKAVYGLYDLTGTWPITLLPNDTVMVGVSFDGSGYTTCNLGFVQDTVIVASSGVLTTVLMSAQVLIPGAVLDTFGMGGGGVTGGLFLQATNTTKIKELYLVNDPNDMMTWPNLVFTASLAVGLVDGPDTVLHIHSYKDQTLLPASGETTWGNLDYGRYWVPFEFMGNQGGRISGRATAFMDQNGTEGLLYNYWVTNACDTPVQAAVSFFADIDVGSYTGNTMGVIPDQALGYVGEGSSFVGVACLNQRPRNIRGVNNPTYVWPDGGLPWGHVYQEMMATENSTGSTADDWSMIMTFDTATLAPGDSALYRIAMMYSPSGTGAFGPMIDGIKASHYTDSAMLKLSREDVLIHEALPGLGIEENLTVAYVNNYVVNQGRMPWTSTHVSSWLEVSMPSGLSNDTIRLSAKLEGLAPGIYYDTLVITCDSAANSPVTVPIELRVNSGTGVITVPTASIPTIATACNLAFSGDTVLVEPGVYHETLLLDKSIVLMSAGGPEVTELVQPYYGRVLYVMDYYNGTYATVEVSGFTIRGYVEAGWGHTLKVIGNIFRDISFTGSYAVKIGPPHSYADTSIIADNIFSNISLSATKACISGYQVRVSNNTFYNVTQGVVGGEGFGEVRNNVFAKVPRPAITGSFDLSCNLFWDVDSMYVGVTAGMGDTVANPGFCYPASGDFRLVEGSVCLPANNSCGERLGAVDEVGCTLSCVLRGDVTHDGSVAVSDLTYLITYLFRGGPTPMVLDEADMNNDGSAAVSDLTYLVGYLFRGGPAPVPCLK